jgi:hypothetical protein
VPIPPGEVARIRDTEINTPNPGHSKELAFPTAFPVLREI